MLGYGQVMALTSSIEEDNYQAEAVIAHSMAEKDSRAKECEGLQKELDCAVEANRKLEHEVANLKAYAVKRAEQSKLNKAHPCPTRLRQCTTGLIHSLHICLLVVRVDRGAPCA